MISSFWNLCRACPSVPVEKLHSEYRSTFQWHEYVGSRADSSVTHHQAVVRQPAAQAHVFWSGGTKGVEIEAERRGRRPDLSINKSSNGWCLKSTADQIRSQNQSQARNQAKLESSGEGSGVPRKSLSMGTIRAFEASVPIHTHKASNAETGVSLTALDSQIVMDTTNKGPDSLEWSEHKAYRENISASYEGDRTSELRKPDRRKEYKSEYKKQFRPFSQYEYVDGKFFKKRGDQEAASPWYKEVIELRKKAGEYRNRGWGTELVPQHLAEVYHQNLWDQVSRRSSLAALALITTTTQKSISKEEKDKENARKSMAKRSLSRPNTATPKHPISDLEKSKADLQGKDSEAVQGAKKKLYDGTASATSRIASAKGKARSQSAGPGGRSPRKATRQVIVPKEKELADVHKPLLRHPRPTTLATSPRPKASSDKGQRDLNSKLVKTLQFDQSSADPSLGFSEPVIKSPPEPTRVKSPEQVILRSPDPVNWTVPLDTTKSFTVTQNIRDAPPSPRFRAGERLHGAEGRTGLHQISGQHSSAGSTKASSPLSTISTRSGLAQTHSLTGPSLAKDKSSIPPSTGPKSGIKPREKENHPVANTEKFGVSTGGGSGISPLKTSIENKTLGSGSSVPHSTINGYNDRKKASQDAGKLEKAKQEDSRVHDKKVISTSGTHSLHDSKPAPASSLSETGASRTVPGTTLRCLEDPTFMFDPPKSTSESPKLSAGTASTTSSLPVAKKGPGGSQIKPNVPPRGAIRVLEAPTVPIPVTTGDKLSFVPPAPVATSKRSGVGASHVSEVPPPQTKLPSYRVLDAPDPSELYGTSSSGGRNRATEVIDKARTRFDKFWGKSKDEEI